MTILNNVTALLRGALRLIRGGLREPVRLLPHKQDPRWWQAGDLCAFEQSVFSQNGEDGIIQEIFRRIGTRHRFFVEFGVETGIECNCARLVREENWSGVFLEPVPELCARLQENYRAWPAVRCQQTAVTSRNIEALLAAQRVPRDLDLLSIDIDGNDYWVWQAIRRWRPRLVVIEYNAIFPPPVRWVMKENLAHRWDGTNYYGASLTSLTLLARAKGYVLVATDSRGVNAFFVRSDLARTDQSLESALTAHYSPFNHPLCPNGHPQGHGPFVEL